MKFIYIIIITICIIIIINYLFWLYNKITWDEDKINKKLNDVKVNHRTGDLVLFSGVGIDSYFGKLASQTDYSRAAILVIMPDDVYVLIMHINHFRHIDKFGNNSGLLLLKFRDILGDGYNYIDIFSVGQDAQLSLDEILQYYVKMRNVEYDRWYYVHYLPDLQIKNRFIKFSSHALLVYVLNNNDKRYCLEVPTELWNSTNLFEKYNIPIPGYPNRKKILYDDLIRLPFVTNNITRIYPTMTNNSLYLYFWWKI